MKYYKRNLDKKKFKCWQCLTKVTQILKFFQTRKCCRSCHYKLTKGYVELRKPREKPKVKIPASLKNVRLR